MLSSIKPTYWLYLALLFAVAAGYSLLFQLARNVASLDLDYAQAQTSQTL